VLAPNGQYDVTATYTLPIDLQGSYYVIVKTDKDNQVRRRHVREQQHPPATSATAISLTARRTSPLARSRRRPLRFAGQGFSLTIHGKQQRWRDQHRRNSSGFWYDAVYLSSDQVFDRNSDTQVGYVQ